MNSIILKLITKPIFLPLAIILNLLHPILHPFEAGGLDAFIEWVNMMAFTEASR